MSRIPTILLVCSLSGWMIAVPCPARQEGRDAGVALAGLDVAEGLEARLFAAEPQVLSLTNLDVDHRGRVWVCEVVNYRGRNGQRPAGDRILICTDNDGDGICDETKVYFQGPEVDSAMGICVLGNQVIISASPNIWRFTDDDGDDRPDRRELLFSQTGSVQHDHSAHAFVFGPDGKLYWNFGNEGHAVHDAQGNLLSDRFGRPINDRGQPYWGGMVFRCNPDGSELEVLAHNFRNNYEVAVDSFGGLWQSDNDDDGNQGVRINFVMEYGNYGYVDELSGAGWQTPRTGLEREIAQRHWHQADPGVVPNLLVTGAGSPTGILVYEGTLLPERFRNQVIHCDAGPNIVRSYSASPQGAGYQVTDVHPLLVGTRDNWFRPSDVAAAPDGSLFIADWYDPGVGGHAMGDVDRGRLFRLAPQGTSYRVPRYDYERSASACEALKNPCQAVRYEAWRALTKMGPAAVPDLVRLANDENPRFRARALWLWGAIDGQSSAAVERALSDPDPEIRGLAVRLARRNLPQLSEVLSVGVHDPAPSVRREVAIALREYAEDDASALWSELASAYDGSDRWYLEALGIAAEGRWNEFLSAWLERVGEEGWTHPHSIDVIWRSRADVTANLLARLIALPETDPALDLRLLRAMDFQAATQRELAATELLKRAEEQAAGGAAPAAPVLLEIAARVPEFYQREAPHVRSTVVAYLQESTTADDWISWTARLQLTELHPRLATYLLHSSDRNLAGQAVRALFESHGADQLTEAWNSATEEQQVALVHGLQASGRSESLSCLLALWPDSSLSILVRSEITKALGAWPDGQRFLLQQVAGGSFPDDLRFPAANVLLTSGDSQTRDEAAKYLTMPRGAEERPLPPLAELVRRPGDHQAGAEVFAGVGTCGKCHRVNGQGTEVGPDLSQVGGKLSVEALYESILNPSAGISHNFEMYKAIMVDGRTIQGVLISRTPQEIVLKDKEAVVLTLPAADVEELTKQTKSLMPDDLQKLLTEQQLVDVVSYLQTLR